MLKRTILSLSVLLMVIGLAVSAQAALVDMNDGTIYDTDTQLSWLKNAKMSGLMTWDQAVAWAASLNSGSGFAGLTGWRLPNAVPSCGINYNCTNSEMGHLYYTELGNPAGSMTPNIGPFTNVDYTYYSWLGTEYAPDTTQAWDFQFSGFQATLLKDGSDGSNCAWAVRPGARTLSTPVPAIGTVGLIILGAAGLIIIGIRHRKSTRYL